MEDVRMARGRPPEGAELVDHLSGSTEAKARLRALLETLSGRQTVRQASQALGISVRRLHAMRHALLQEVLDRLEPRPAGRPTQMAAESPSAGLEAEVCRLRLDLQAARIREEIALAMPHVLNRNSRTKKSPRSSSQPQVGSAGRHGT
jgi:hypothetical protein